MAVDCLRQQRQCQNIRWRLRANVGLKKNKIKKAGEGGLYSEKKLRIKVVHLRDKNLTNVGEKKNLQ